MVRRFVAWLESGEKTAEELLELCWRRIREREAEVQAWVEIRPQHALRDGPLRGIPFGAKDIFETAGLATEYGSPLYKGNKGEQDAALVRQLRERGAVLMGKTHTTAFAYFDPAPTRNPRNPAHTPGGSSSGSAAAVAAAMVPFALGTQTQGSVIRPASFCGVTGFKPSRGLLPLDGVLPFAPSLDTAGLFTQTPEDLMVLWQRMGYQTARTGPRRMGLAEELLAQVEPPMATAVRAAAERLGARSTELPPKFHELLPAVRTINDYEGARTHQERWRQHGDRIGRKLSELVRRGLAIPEDAYRAALETVGEAGRAMARLFEEYPVILSPAAVGPAPRGLESTGDPRMNAPWTALGTPALALPLPVREGLPLGLQMTGALGSDALLVKAAADLRL